MAFFNLASQRMNWLSARQKVIAENVANANTPGYKAQDISDFSDMLGSNVQPSGVKITQARHISSAEVQAPGIRVEADETAWATSMDGNNVTIEQQTIKAGEVSESYRLAANLYRKGYELLTLSVTGNR
ncbi:flagellar basal body rod protein FlgB [Albibacillus kandeliae]|jgi:flagellar basal-body rod protein FlgB|uniref:flagellar basal body rod protein FlgB n=1 Tax=Albibacillus kandeliae TaxID=2174228 RepID=UPI001E601408|nr:flagellar basal body rod protein FlgB [Albibacillus kandeliae]